MGGGGILGEQSRAGWLAGWWCIHGVTGPWAAEDGGTAHVLCMYRGGSGVCGCILAHTHAKSQRVHVCACNRVGPLSLFFCCASGVERGRARQAEWRPPVVMARIIVVLAQQRQKPCSGHSWLVSTLHDRCRHHHRYAVLRPRPPLGPRLHPPHPLHAPYPRHSHACNPFALVSCLRLLSTTSNRALPLPPVLQGPRCEPSTPHPRLLHTSPPTMTRRTVYAAGLVLTLACMHHTPHLEMPVPDTDMSQAPS